MLRASLLLGAALLTASACNPTDFDQFEDQATIRASSKPDGYRRSLYGSVLTTYSREAGSAEVSRIVASAGAGSPVAFITAWDGANPRFGTSLRCKKDDDCEGGGVASALAAFPRWAQGLPFEEEGCVLTPGDPRMFVFCETSPSFKQSIPGQWNIDLPTNWELRFSAVGLPEASPLGVALIGVHSWDLSGNRPGTGKVVYQPDLQSQDGEIQANKDLIIVDPFTGTGFQQTTDEEESDYGYQVAQHALPSGELLVAISQPSHERVILATNDGESTDMTLRGCIRSPNPELKGFGRVLALGDVNDDGIPEVFTGIDPLADDNTDAFSQRLYMYDGEGLPEHDPDALACPDWTTPWLNVSCINGKRGITNCADTGFGASVAVGDVNGDGFGDVAIGAPRTDVQGVEEAGVVWLIPGGPKADSEETYGLDTEGTTVLLGNGLNSDANIGTSVAMLKTGEDRYEPVAGAPGEDKVFTWFCTPLAGDDEIDTLCL